MSQFRAQALYSASRYLNRQGFALISLRDMEVEEIRRSQNSGGVRIPLRIFMNRALSAGAYHDHGPGGAPCATTTPTPH
jgi:hypothetical protein